MRVLDIFGRFLLALILLTPFALVMGLFAGVYPKTPLGVLLIVVTLLPLYIGGEAVVEFGGRWLGPTRLGRWLTEPEGTSPRRILAGVLGLTVAIILFYGAVSLLPADAPLMKVFDHHIGSFL